MAVIQTLVLLTSALLTSGQRPSFAGSRPIGYPVLTNRTTTPSALEDKFGEGTTQRLPLEALGDRELVDRLSKLPIDKQPFWFINWQAYEANRNKPQTYPQRPNPFLEGNLQNPQPISTNPDISDAHNGSGNIFDSSVNTNPPQPVITNPVNTVDVNNSVKPPTPKINTGQTGVNNKSGDSELGNRFANEITSFVSTTDISETTTKIQDAVKSNVDSSNDSNAKKPVLAIVKPSNFNNKNVAPISNSYQKDIVTINSDDSDNHQDIVQGNLNTDANIKIPELTTDQSGINTDEKIHTVAVSDHNDINKIINNDNFELVKSRTDTNTDSDIKKPDIKVNHGLTNTDINLPKFPRRKSLGTPKDYDYEDIAVKKVIKLYPGIIPLYQR